MYVEFGGGAYGVGEGSDGWHKCMFDDRDGEGHARTARDHFWQRRTPYGRPSNTYTTYTTNGSIQSHVLCIMVHDAPHTHTYTRLTLATRATHHHVYLGEQ